jgi:glycosyltransferase involved in cell wall biosynthesis
MYSELNIINAENKSIENFFLKYNFENNLKYDFVITHFTQLFTGFYKNIKKTTAAKIIAIDHNPRPIGGFSIKKKIKNKIRGVYYYKYIDKLIAVSKYSKINLLNDFGGCMSSKISVIYNGIDVYKYSKKNNFGGNNNFMTASHLRETKGIQDLIDAVVLLESKLQKDLNIDIYGEGPYQNYLKNKVKIHNLEGVINFKGSVANLNEKYCKYDYLIHPSHGETFCYTVIESLASNLPVITTNKGGNVLGKVIEGKNGFLFDFKDSIKLSKILKDILLKNISIPPGNYHSEIEDEFSIEKMVQNHLSYIK